MIAGTVAAVVFLNSLALGQTQAGGARAGIGRVFDGAGRSTASKELQQKMNGGLLKLAAAKAKAKAAKARALPPSRPSAGVTATRREESPAAPPPPSYTDFRPARDTDFVDRFAAAVSADPNERQLVKQLVTTVRDAFEQEVAKQGRPNNLAAAFTFFVASTVTVYHDDPEPSDASTDKLWDALNETLNDLPEMSRLTDAEKQEMYELLVACGGLVLAGHMFSKQNNDAKSAAVYRQLAGELIKTLLKADPEKLRFNSGGLEVKG